MSADAPRACARSEADNDTLRAPGCWSCGPMCSHSLRLLITSMPGYCALWLMPAQRWRLMPLPRRSRRRYGADLALAPGPASEAEYAVSGTDIVDLCARARTREPAAVEALADWVEAQLLRAQPRRRGGDPWATERAQRDAALRRLAAMMNTDMPAQRLARVLTSRLARYRPRPAERAPARQLMREVVTSGLPVPGPDRLARILRTR